MFNAEGKHNNARKVWHRSAPGMEYGALGIGITGCLRQNVPVDEAPWWVNIVLTKGAAWIVGAAPVSTNGGTDNNAAASGVI